MKKQIFSALIAGSILFLIMPGAEAVVLPQMTMEEMVLKADAIVTGRGEHFHVHPGPEGNVLYAFVTFKVEEYLKNNLQEEEIMIMQIAREKGPDGEMISGPLALKMDEEVVLFLTEEDDRGFRHIFGLSQGKYVVTRDWFGRKRLIQDMKGVQFFDLATGALTPSKETIRIQLTYEEFKTLVHRLVPRIEAQKKHLRAQLPNNFF